MYLGLAFKMLVIYYHIFQNPDGVKKNPFDDLSKEELITKCKGLLAIAQKAKQAKSGKVFIALLMLR